MTTVARRCRERWRNGVHRFDLKIRNSRFSVCRTSVTDVLPPLNGLRRCRSAVSVRRTGRRRPTLLTTTRRWRLLLQLLPRRWSRRRRRSPTTPSFGRCRPRPVAGASPVPPPRIVARPDLARRQPRLRAVPPRCRCPQQSGRTSGRLTGGL